MMTVKSLLGGCLLLLVCFACGPNNDTTNDGDQSSVPPPPGDYRLTGQGDTTLVFIHGWNIDQSYWDQQVAAFAPQYKVLTMNLLNDSLLQDSSRAWTMREFAEDVVAIVEYEGLDNLVLVGHSMSGDVALEINELIPEPVIAIIGVDNFKDLGFQPDTAVDRQLRGMLQAMRDDYPTVISGMMMQAMFPPDNFDSTALRRVEADYLAADQDVAIAILENLIPASEKTKQYVEKLDFPLRIIMSDYAPYDEEALKRYAKQGYAIKLIENAGHFPMIEQPEQFNAALRAFLGEMSN